MQSNFSCYFENFTHTRSRSACFGNSTSFSGRRARELGFFEDVALCLEHYRVSRKKSKKCCVLFDFSRCFGPLRSCPERLYAVLDDITGEPAAFICQWHHNNIDSAEEVTSHQRYRPPAKRSSVASMPEEEIEVGSTQPRDLYLYLDISDLFLGLSHSHCCESN